MKRCRNFQRAIGIAALVLGLSMGADVALAQVLGNPEVVQPNSNEFGNTYGEWSGRWSQWLLSIPEATNPAVDATGANCAEGQSGQVWFLAGTFGGPAVTRSCTIPGGKDLLFPIITGVFGEGVGDCTGPLDCDPTALRAAAAKNADNPVSLEATIDYVRVKNLGQYRVTSPVFNAFFPPSSINGTSAGTHGPLVSDGYWLLLSPLSPGAHTIHFKGVFNVLSNGGTVEVTYLLTVAG
jgi:hypothetical protein